MKKLIFVGLLISISAIFGWAQTVTTANQEEAKAISEVSVTLLTPSGEKVQSVVTDKQGTFDFSNVTAGKYLVMVGKYDVKAVKGPVEYHVLTARDAGSGMATGRRQYQPLLIRKRIDKSAPLLSQGSSGGAVLVAIPTEKSALTKENVCDDNCPGYVAVTLEFGERVKAGLQQAGSALANGASLLGGSLPGGSVLSSALTIQQGIEIKAAGNINGSIMMVTKVKTKSNNANEKQTQGATFGEKVKHDTVKNSIGNIR